MAEDNQEQQSVSPFEGKPCPDCGARLRVTLVHPEDYATRGGVTSSEYECEGNPPHRWAEMKDLPVPGRRPKVRLMRQDDEPEP